MELLLWYPVSAGPKGFPADQTGRYIPGEWIEKQLRRGLSYYLLKKEKGEGKKFVKMVQKGEEVASFLSRLIEESGLWKGVQIPSKLYLDPKKIGRELVKFYNREKGWTGREWREVYRDAIPVELSLPNWEKWQVVMESYSRGLAEFIHKQVKGEAIEWVVAEVQNSIANEWEVPILVGEWGRGKLPRHFLHIWSFKELREKFNRKGVFAVEVAFIPRLQVVTGWCELKK